MPFKSEKHRKYMHINEPEVAKKWEKKYGGKISRKDLRNMVDEVIYGEIADLQKYKAIIKNRKMNVQRRKNKFDS